MEFRKICTAIRQVKNVYWIDTNGDIYSECKNYRFGILKDGKIKNYRFKSKVKKELNNLTDVFKKVNFDGFDFVLTLEGKLLKKMKSTINKSGHKSTNFKLTTESKQIFQNHRVCVIVFNRSLRLNEIVHHIDHNKLNNKLNNLVIMDIADHSSYHRNLTLNNVTKAAKILKKYNI